MLISMKINKIIFLTIFFLLVTLTSIVATSKVKAQDFQILDHTITIDIEEDGTAEYTAKLKILNSGNENVLTGYEYILPTTKPVKSSVKLRGRDVVAPVYRIDEGPYSLIDISFGDDVLAQNQEIDIKITATLQSFVKSRKDTKYLMLRSTNDRIDQFTINYPESFGKPVLATQKKDDIAEEKDSGTLELGAFNSALLIWGTEYTIDVSSRLTILGGQTNTIARIPLIPELPGQSVDYRRVFSGQYGLYDRLDNVYAAVSLDSSKETDVGYEARVTKQPQKIEIRSNLEYNFNWQEELELINRLEFEESNDLFLSLESLHNALISEIPADFSTSEVFTDSTEYWNSLDKKEGLNSFNYCYILTAYAEHIGLDAEIRYGYPVIPDLLSDVIQPHVWCVFSDGENTILADPFYQVVNNLVYFGAQYDFDRITIGTWDPGLEENALLGLMSDNESKVIKTISIEEFGNFTSQSPELTMTVPDKEGVYSGFFFDLYTTVKNDTSKLLNIDKVIFRDKEIAQVVSEDYRYSLLPNQSNEIRITGLRNPYFFSGGSLSEKIGLTFVNEDIQAVMSTVKVKYKIHLPLFAFSWSALSILIVFSSIFVWKRLQKIRKSF
jgi:hypothetical protein